jgi:hypothetical protein
MCHSSSIKTLHQSSAISLNNDEEQIRDLISSLIDKIDKDMNISDDTNFVLFNASSNTRRRLLSDKQTLDNDVYQSVDDHKHSHGILINDEDMPSRKKFFSLLSKFY